MSDTVLIPGGRDVRATLDAAAGDDTRSEAVVVACPPHPRHGGHRGDERLVAASDALTDRGIDCLRFDYGAYDEGYGECTDADNAVGWALDRYARVGLFGYSFGGTVALVAAASGPKLAGVCALAPTDRLASEIDAVAALDDLAARGASVRIVYANRDATVDWEPVVERARELGLEVVELDADHFLVGRAGDAAEPVAEAFGRWLRGEE
ncbi:alpha/beta hydrolase [Halorubrum halodurans]|uniref:Alpha/beta hydrolase n=1 Tax=Halorubrum halodurans TaxID=1383851 RepID=A0A256IQA0_9EURY|nr:alpha/beta hydrolase [Halorubrum halodurans]OYR58466.1 alpha/beta hydrolase [Halorubrum halodurans]